jgi:hypothetical protein
MADRGHWLCMGEGSPKLFPFPTEIKDVTIKEYFKQIIVIHYEHPYL